ncbi:MAG: hypothetical protein F4X65_06630 [Chloroflexi bacterium]|nr:hypothetical protein [Chloroflexota bacterium]
MTMQSSNLLPALRELPSGDESGQERSFRENITGIVNMDRAMYGAEFATGVSGGLWGILDSANVDDTLAEAFLKQYPNEAEAQSLYEQWQEMMERGPESMKGFVGGLKGKVAEIELASDLEQRGFSNVEIHPDPSHPIWDIKAETPDGNEILIQVKTGGEDRVSEIRNLMTENEDVHYAVSTEIYDKLVESAPEELIERLIDVGQNYHLIEGMKDGLNTLVGNLGIDIPDGIVEIIPYSGAIFASARLIMNIIKTKKDYNTPDLSTKARVQTVQTLALLAQVGPKTLLSIVAGKGGAIGGGTLGTAAGTVVPGIGNAIGGGVGTIAGGIGGAFVGYRIGNYLGKHLEPHAINLALKLTNLTYDDLFYYKNKPRIDNVALSYQETARTFALPA